jgi:hypothetical protein
MDILKASGKTWDILLHSGLPAQDLDDSGLSWGKSQSASTAEFIAVIKGVISMG